MLCYRGIPQKGILLFSFPVFGSKCSPVQHMVNILCALLLGPGYGLGAAFAASLIRNLLGLGSLMAFPGSMFGALACGVVYAKTRNILGTLIGEVFGTAVLGGLCAYPIAIFFMGQSAAGLAFYAYIIPFFINNNVEIATKCHGDGIHVGQEDMDAAQVRQRVGFAVIAVEETISRPI